MVYQFSERIKTLQPSAIREILKVTADPSVISFAGGNPSAKAFPVADMAQIAADLFENEAGRALQYGISEGYTPLRELTEQRMRRKFSIGGENDDTLIVSGGQQGIELSAKILCNEGDTVICEEPSFIGALNAFRSYKLKLTGIPLQPDGMDLERLEAVLKEDRRVKLLYIISTFQNPSGITTSKSKRKRLLELAEKYNFIILEDSPYFELRYSGSDVPPLKSTDSAGRVIFVGSYSKILSPGMRVGYTIASKELSAKLVVAKQVSDVHTNQFFSMLVARYLESRDIDAHIEGIRRLYRAKRDRMLSAIEAFFPKEVKVYRPDGGLFIWCELPGGFDGAELCRRAGAKKVAAVPGSAFAVDEGKTSPCIRLNFSMPEDEQIDEGIEILGGVTGEYVSSK